MKRILTLIMLMAVCLCLFACGDDSAVAGMKLASNTDVVDYKLYVPEGWLVSEAQRGATQAFVSDTDRTNVLVMQWNITENTKTVSEWWEKEYKPQVFTSEAVKDVTVDKNSEGAEGEEITLGAKPATRYGYEGKVGDSYFKYDVIACVTQGSIYVIQFTYMQDAQEVNGNRTYSTIELHKEDVGKIVANFRFD